MRVPLALSFLVVLSGLAAAQDSPRVILERAIVAHGGQAQLSAARAEKVRLRGTLHVGQQAMAFTNDMTLHLPGKFRSQITINQGGQTHVFVHLLDEDRATMLIDGKEQPVTAAHRAQLRQTLRQEQVLRLVSLLSSGFTLHPLPEVRYNEMVYVGVRVVAAGQRDLDLHFDRASGLLVKVRSVLEGPNGKDLVQEVFYGNYRELGGYRRPCKIVILRDGKTVMDAEVVEARRLERIDPAEFSHP